MLHVRCLLMLLAMLAGLAHARQARKNSDSQQASAEIASTSWQPPPATVVAPALQVHADLSHGTAHEPPSPSWAAVRTSQRLNQGAASRSRRSPTTHARNGSTNTHHPLELMQTDGYTFGSKSAARAGMQRYHNIAGAIAETDGHWQRPRTASAHEAHANISNRGESQLSQPSWAALTPL